MRKFGLTLTAAAVLLASSSAMAAGAPPIISGQVRDAHGTPQIGALVELLRPDASVVATAFTDQHGRYSLVHIAPGNYGVKATGTLFLPTLRENLRLSANSHAIVDLTLSTLFEAIQWLPAKRRAVDEPADDWAWTLRSSVNRPLLRMLEDGPLLVVSDAEMGAQPVLKARVVVHSGDNAFGEGGLHHAFELERSRDESHELILRADLGEQEGTAVGTSLSYEQRMGPGQAVRTVASFSNRPSIQGANGEQGLGTIRLRSAQTLQLSPSLDAQVGNEMLAVKMGKTLMTSHPFGSLEWHEGELSLTYNVATSREVQDSESIDRSDTAMPLVSERGGALQLEHGLHQSITARAAHDRVRVQMVFFRDHVQNPVVNGGGRISENDWRSGDVMYDPATELLRVAGGDYSSNGVLAEFRDRLGEDTWVSFLYGTGSALTLKNTGDRATLAETVSSLQANAAPVIAASFHGKLKSTGTQWRASYRWQPSDTVTAVAPFSSSVPEAYLGFFVRQPIRYKHILPAGMEALIDVRNLMAEGYRPFLTTDGSTIYFAQADRSIQGGLSFSF